MAVPMLPRMAMPAAPPSSEHVSEIADAAPARSGGAAPMMMAFASVNTGERPRENTMVLATTMGSPEVPSTRASHANPAEEMTRPTAIRTTGRTRRARTGDNMDPNTKPRANGIDHRPALIGERPSTNCKYWAMKTYDPKTAKVASMYATSEALNRGARNRRTSIKGSASL